MQLFLKRAVEGAPADLVDEVVVAGGYKGGPDKGTLQQS